MKILDLDIPIIKIIIFLGLFWNFLFCKVHEEELIDENERRKRCGIKPIKSLD